MVAVAVAISAVAVVLAVMVKLDRADKFKELVLELASGIMDEGVAYAEVNTVSLKRETVFNATKAWQKQKPEVLKDQVQADRFLQDAMKPAREIAHNQAKEYIKGAVSALPASPLKTAVARCLSDANLDHAIRIRISAAKINLPNPIKPFLYRFL